MGCNFLSTNSISIYLIAIFLGEAWLYDYECWEVPKQVLQKLQMLGSENCGCSQVNESSEREKSIM